MAATPPPASVRARTPPTPLHGPQYDNYEPYSPRRSTRTTAHNNPYSSLNASKPSTRNTTPPTTVKRARFARAPAQLSSPPSSPVSPIKRQTIHKTPRKQPAVSAGRFVTGTHSDSDGPFHSLAPAHIDPVTMLPTPSKTPKKRPAAALNPRILNFQPDDPNDVMPMPRKIRKHGGRQHTGASGFELYEDDTLDRADEIALYTDANARVPEMDESEDNPFVGRALPQRQRPGRRNNKNAAELALDRSMDQAVKREEGLTYVFRGKRVFRKFKEADNDETSSVEDDLGATSYQRSLKQAAGAAAQRPLTRSAIKPRLLFPPEEGSRIALPEEADEEAVTDIDMPNANSPDNVDGPEDDSITPIRDSFTTATPPPTNRATRSKGKRALQKSADAASPPDEEVDETPHPGDEALSAANKRQTKNLFDSWQRTKGGGTRKRGGDSAKSSPQQSSKRARGNPLASPT